jgi:methionine aminotransferase
LYDYSAISKESDVEFTRRLTRDIGVATIPISAFYDQPPEQHVIRICFAKKTDTLQQAADRLSSLPAAK